ncbi:helix-turn-helix domain-containing protein [Corynebacterium cystitidis]|uniref:helix-turn-helix domain-containing protein n=1 Tax=Corynebacterium cystitidis TaxID=35757 RepID=UPI00211E21DC|nr:helix-turn-helix transcriptional regulator [Corynebacterium cystitidis]
MADVLQDHHWASYGYSLSERLKRLRERRGITQLRLAELSGVSRTLLSNLERNHYNSQRSADPTLSTLYRLALGLQVPPAALLPAVDREVEEVCPDDLDACAHLHWVVEGD